jgi:hypothetical protein
MGWDKLTDRELLLLASKSFNVFVTIDKSLEFQQNTTKLSFGVIVVAVPKNQIHYY